MLVLTILITIFQLGIAYLPTLGDLFKPGKKMKIPNFKGYCMIFCCVATIVCTILFFNKSKTQEEESRSSLSDTIRTLQASFAKQLNDTIKSTSNSNIETFTKALQNFNLHYDSSLQTVYKRIDSSQNKYVYLMPWSKGNFTSNDSSYMFPLGIENQGTGLAENVISYYRLIYKKDDGSLISGKMNKLLVPNTDIPPDKISFVTVTIPKRSDLNYDTIYIIIKSTFKDKRDKLFEDLYAYIPSNQQLYKYNYNHNISLINFLKEIRFLK